MKYLTREILQPQHSQGNQIHLGANLIFRKDGHFTPAEREAKKSLKDISGKFLFLSRQWKEQANPL